MLADDLIASPELAILGEGRRQFVDHLRAAHRFEFDGAFANAADALGTTRPSAFERALGLCRLPYPLTWFEVANADRRRFQGSCGPEKKPIRRIGALFSSGESSSGWIAHLAWNFQDGSVNLCPVAVGFDFSGPLTFDKLYETVDRQKLAAKMREANDPWADYPDEVDASLRFTKRTLVMPSLYHMAAFSHLATHQMMDAGQKIVSAGQDDWENEHPFWLGALALLNSHNTTQIVEGRDNTKLNKLRVRSGKHELLTFKTCRISPRLKTRIASENDLRGEGIRAHFVRGHFKIRKSGIFWWSPFLRGDAKQGLVMKDYRVTRGGGV